ncbi:MAG TPA: hypothetical protein OIM48_00295 [Clostridiaceae bacterium]|nr:hypothetical protein [Clostridium sp.]HJJ11747.1 hypothetical protein [Clostridiaceae bacterium]
MDVEIEGYHGTDKENIESICSNNFEIKKDLKNKLFLGFGAYFFFEYEDAVDWNVKELRDDLNRVPKYDELQNKKSVVKADIKCKDTDILNLDDKEMLLKFEILVEKYQGKLSTKPEFINAKNKTAAIINMLYQRKLIKRNIIIKTFIETIKTNRFLQSLKNYPRKMICVKDNKYISNIYEYNELSKEKYDSIVYFY